MTPTPDQPRPDAAEMRDEKLLNTLLALHRQMFGPLRSGEYERTRATYRTYRAEALRRMAGARETEANDDGK